MRLVWALALGLCACRSGGEDDIITEAGFGEFDGGDATVFFFDVVEPLDAPPDVGIDSGHFNGGGPFMCSSCICDGTQDLCFSGGGGAPMPFADAGASDASACTVLDAGNGPCRMIPLACLPKPTCACVMSFYGNNGACHCSVTDDGNGLKVECIYP